MAGLPDRFGPFVVLNVVGAGGMGEVYRARDSRLNRDVAVKVLTGAGTDPARQRRFGDEAQAASALNHPNIVTVYDVGIQDGVPFAQPLRGAAKAIRDPRLHADLKLAGHRVSIAEDERALIRALESDRVDVVLTDAADADRVAADANAAPAKPRVLPVMFEPTKADAKAIEDRYQVHLTSSDRSIRYLAAIDDAMKARVQERKKKVS